MEEIPPVMVDFNVFFILAPVLQSPSTPAASAALLRRSLPRANRLARRVRSLIVLQRGACVRGSLADDCQALRSSIKEKLMTRRTLLTAALLAASCLSYAGAEGISFNLPESSPGSSFASAFTSPNPFATSGEAATSPAIIAAPPASLLAPVSVPQQSRGGAFGGLSSEADPFTNPLGHLASATSYVLATSGRYESGAASRLSGLPTAESGLIQRMQIPTAGFGTSRGELSGTPMVPYMPTATPQVYFGAR